jgi:hypothetical protein
MCEEHRVSTAKTSRESSKKKYHKRKEEGLCPSCGNELSGDLKTCLDCRDRIKKATQISRQQRLKQNLCIICGLEKSDSGLRCKSCIEKRNQWYAQSKYKDNLDRERRIIRAKVFDYYGHECVNCGETKPSCLVIDHIDGGGNEHRKQITGSGS